MTLREYLDTHRECVLYRLPCHGQWQSVGPWHPWFEDLFGPYLDEEGTQADSGWHWDDDDERQIRGVDNISAYRLHALRDPVAHARLLREYEESGK